MTTTFLTAALVALTTALPVAADATWSGTGPRGGSYAGSGGCIHAAGAWTCSGTTQAVNPWGGTATRQRLRSVTPDAITGQLVTTGPRGNTTVRTWQRQR